jgi:hypothetical protein
MDDLMAITTRFKSLSSSSKSTRKERIGLG